MVFEHEFGEMLHDALDLGVNLLGAGAGIHFGLGELEGDELGFVYSSAIGLRIFIGSVGYRLSIYRRRSGWDFPSHFGVGIFLFHLGWGWGDLFFWLVGKLQVGDHFL